MPDLVTVARFRDLPEALLAKGKLESAEIPCVLADAETVRTDWLYSNVIGGIRLQVADKDVEAATGLLSEAIPDEFTADDETYTQPRCPRCGSVDVQFGKRKGGVFLSWLVLGFPLPIHGRKRWKCASCSTEWIEAPDVEQGPPAPGD